MIGTVSNWQLTAKLGRNKGASWPITDAPLVVGRAADCNVVLRDPLVSRRHCAIRAREDAVSLLDMGSSNSTLVNGRPVVECELHPGDEVSIGGATFMLTRTKVNEGRTPTPGHSGTTLALPIHKTPGNSAVTEAIPRDVRDLATLHDMSTRLGALTAIDDVVAVVLECAEESLSESRVAVVTVEGTEGPIRVVPNLGSLAPAITESVKGLCEPSRDPIGLDAAPQLETNPRPTAFIPILGKPGFGVALILESGIGHAGIMDSEVGFARCLAETAAPYFTLLTSDVYTRASAQTSSIAVPELTLVGESQAIQHVRRAIAMAAHSRLPVLLFGETGTGKELVARLIHRASDRRGRAFLAVNCAAVQDSLFESEFFGHVQGAFTGANEDKAGLMQEADGGILFLDEIADLSPLGQSRLLRAMESGAYRPVGGREELNADVWVIAASNRDLLQAVQDGTFRNDLYYRLAGIEIPLPSLREHREDIGLLAEHFKTEYENLTKIQYGEFSASALEFLASLVWPGNVREFRNSIDRALALAQGEDVQPELLRSFIRVPSRAELPRTVEEVEKEHIGVVLQECGGKITEAARVLGLHRNTLARKIRQYGLGS